MGRPRIHEVLTVPREIFKKLRDIADEARMPMQLVYEDALLNGIVTLKDMYASAVQFRKTRDALINEPFGSVVHKPEESRETEQVSGASNGDIDPEFNALAGDEKDSPESSSDDIKQRGPFEESMADPGLPVEYSGEPGE